MTRRRNDRTGGTADKPDPLTDLERALLAEGRRRVTVRDGGEPVEMSVNEIIARKTAETAAKGSPHAQRIWLNATAEAVARENAIKEEDAAFWRAYQRHYRSEIAQARKKGEPAPEPVPHPDDIVIDDKNNISIDGPVTDAEAQVYAHIAKQREAFMRLHVLDERRAEGADEGPAKETLTSAFLMSTMANSVLPQRLQLGPSGVWHLCCRFRRQTQRELLKDNYRAWKQLGFPAKRDAMSPSLDMLRQVMPALARIAGDLASSGGSERDVDEAIARVMQLGKSAKT